MRSGFRLVSFIVITHLFVLPALAQEEKKTEKKEKITPAGEIAGRVTAVDGAQKTLTLQVTRQKTLQVATMDDVKIRTLMEPVFYDDKGKPRKPTAKERKELKDKDGYKADWEDLKVNAIVKVTLGRKKGDKNPLATIIVIERAPK
jgi:hypothetical protein